MVKPLNNAVGRPNKPVVSPLTIEVFCALHIVCVYLHTDESVFVCVWLQDITKQNLKA